MDFEVRDHLSQHEAAKELPLLTESATVTAVEPMDANRNDEIVDAMFALLDEHGTDQFHEVTPDGKRERRRWIRDRLDEVNYVEARTPLDEYLRPPLRGGRIGRRLHTLQQRYIRPYPSLFRIVVEPDDPIDFLAGQYLSLRYEGTSRPYSVASSPTRDDVEFCIGRVPGGELTSELAVTLEPGDEVTLRGPYGDLLLHDPSPRDVVFLATGTGAAPFKGMIDYLFEKGWDVYGGETRDVWLFLGAGWEDDLAYREEFRELAAERENFHFVPTLSREPFVSDWDGETDYVQYTLAKYLDPEAVAALDGDLDPEYARYVGRKTHTDVDARLDPASMEVYACGLNAMVASLVMAVDALGVPEEYTEFEGFG